LGKKAAKWEKTATLCALLAGGAAIMGVCQHPSRPVNGPHAGRFRRIMGYKPRLNGMDTEVALLDEREYPQTLAAETKVA